MNMLKGDSYERSNIYSAVVSRIRLCVDCAGRDENSLPIPASEVGRFYSYYFSTVFAGEGIIACAVSPVIWLLSYVVTGAPRILLWKKNAVTHH